MCPTREGLDLGLFIAPLHLPERPLADCWDDDVALLVHAERCGYSEAWVGEHYCIRWENQPAPELLIAKALALTNRIRLGTGVQVIGYHHPAILAHKVAALDHLSRGRLMLGIGPGGTPSDFEMMGIDIKGDEARRRMVESIDMMSSLWTSEGRSVREGEFWNLKVPFGNRKTGWEYHIRPYQHPHPPIAIAGTSAYSRSLAWGSSRGYIPMSFFDLNPAIIRSHWEAICEGAAKGGHVARRADWRVARIVYVAESDDAARAHVRESSMPRVFLEYFRRVTALFGGLGAMKHNVSVADEEVDVEYMLEHVWMVGSPRTVAEKLYQFHAEVGGFGTLLVVHFDTFPHPQRFHKSLVLLREEVLPLMGSEGVIA
jgi:alkanesulfonate monooxygenase SsuD/methylene tetrahydromethanopterin reductase-like flavin-dependent oxidoreductase (luciferase family)